MKKIYSDEFKKVLIHSRSEAMKSGDKLIRADHFLLGILYAPDNEAYEIISQKTDSFDELREKLTEHLKTYSQAHVPFDIPEGAINLDADAGMALQTSMTESSLMHMDKVLSTHLLLALLRDSVGFVSKCLNEMGITYDYVREQIYARHQIDIEEAEAVDSSSDNEVKEQEFDESASEYEDDIDFERVKSGSSKKNTRSVEYLKKYGSDLTQDALQGKLDPVVGREVEIERVAQILSRRKKNNPILIGEAGVGKTAIVEGLAQRIIEGSVPVTLADKRIFSLNMASVVAGTKYRGQFEERLQGIVKELSEHPEIILFVDEIHTIIGAGSTQGTMDAANLLKPALARGVVQCIGATTIDEYRKSIEKDGALERRFQKVMVSPTSVEETIMILDNIKGKYEDHHNVKYSDKAIEACVRLTERYISDRKLPDKAIDALDETGSRKHIMDVKMPKELKDMERDIATKKDLKTQAVKEQRYEDASKLRDQIESWKDSYTQKRQNGLCG